MKKKILPSIATLVLLLFVGKSYSQTLNLGILESFEGYTGSGGITNSGGFITGDVGTNSGIISGLTPPEYTGNIYNANASTSQAKNDLLRLYIHLNSLPVNFPSPFNPLLYPAHAASFGGEILAPGVYSIGSAGDITGALTLNGGGNPNAVFVIKMNGAMTVAAGASVTLTNGAKSSNVFFIIDGAISVSAGANVIGTLFSKGGAVGLGANATVEGRMLSLAGALTLGVGARANIPSLPCTIPIFCQSSCEPAPAVNILGVLSGFTLFSSNGNVGNTGISGINGTIGTNAGSVSGYTGGTHIGTEQIANALTAQAALDLDAAYNALMAMPATVSHAPAFANETLIPGVYHIGLAGALSGVVILDAANDPNAIFVFRFVGAFNIAAASKIILTNGARRCNVFWLGGAGIDTGAVNIGAAAEVQGTFISHGGACNAGTSVFMAGRQLSTLGAVNTAFVVIYNNPECITSRSLNSVAIVAIADNLTVAAGGSTTSVLANDTYNGAPATTTNVILSVVSNSPQLTLNTDGTVTVTSGTSSGNYLLTYSICERANLTNCTTTSSTITVANPASVGGTTSGNQTICKDSTPGDLTIAGQTGNVIKWQKSVDLLFNSPIDIINLSTTLTGILIGNISETTYFRAVIQDGSSPVQYSSYATITIPSTTWNGTAWSNGIPIANTTAFITGSYSESANIVACTLTISSNAVVTIPSGSSVTLNGKLTVDAGGSFTLNSNSNLIQQTAAVNSGNITVKRLSAPMYRLDYTLWSSPVSGTQKLLDFSPLTNNTRFYFYNTATNQYNSVPPGTTVFDSAKSYLIRSPNDWVPYNASLSPIPISFTGSFTGVPRNGNINFTMSNEGTGFNAIGNPFPSAILLNTFITTNSNAIEGTLWFWRKYNDTANATSYSTCTTMGCTSNNNAINTNSNLISVGQGFIVKAKAGQSNLSFTNAMRSNINVDQFFRTANETMDRYWLKMTNTTNSNFAQNLIAHTPAATVGYDNGLDGLYLNESESAFYSKAGANQVVINARPSFDVTDVIQMHFKSNVATTYTFSLNQKEGIFNGTQAIYLKDNFNNTVHNLTLGNYTFTTVAGLFIDRFNIIYQNLLGNINPTLNANQIIIYNKNQTTFISSGEIKIASFKIFDIQGRLLFSKSGINDTQINLNLNFNNQVLLYHITSQDGDTIIKKVIN